MKSLLHKFHRGGYLHERPGRSVFRIEWPSAQGPIAAGEKKIQKILPAPPAQPVQLNVYPVKSLLHLFNRGGKIEIMRSPEHKVTLIHEKLTIDINSLKTYLHRNL
jgi:hypothetical protein